MTIHEQYTAILDCIYQMTPAFHMVGAAAYKPGLENMQRLLEQLGHPERAFRAVHIAGTNGKGSTSHLIAAALQASGLRVGLYTSPHLVDFRERIKVGGEMIPEEYVVEWLENNLPLLGEGRGWASFFELTTAMAFCYFRDLGVDIAVVECGLGGRLDSTNVLPRVALSVITNIGLDHTEFLGNTLPEIAGEKAGIMRAGVPCIIGDSSIPEVQAVFAHRAAELGGELIAADTCATLREERLRECPECELQGAYQQMNMQTAFVALRALGISPEAIREGFAHVVSMTGLRGRWEVLSEHPLTICDTGHNSHGIRTYVEQLRALANPAAFGRTRHLYMVFGMVNDKDIDTVLDLLPKDAFYYWCNASTHRAVSSDEMRMRGLAHGLIGESFGPVQVALAAARERAGEDDIIFIGGSNYVVGEALQE